MRNIVLFCAAGMSTSLLVNKMKEAAAKENYECQIHAYALASTREKGADADIILLGPQVRFSKAKVEKDCPGKIIECIDMQAYGTMNGAKVIAQVKKALGD
ncbi:PTS sugar transporter subunit IIB [Clostridium sp. Marseille-P2415]|uniref:PTS sugar transporter subunit IIB n=1 Tax=Clostridium sp. Marseille-P2415 TaxID=1805471 RepID=UPI00098838E5|nr:PTS sugar transporter subunit IIB [Clostridium sp. Marseille-P2415]